MYSLFGMFGLGGPEILLLVVLGVLLFGRKLPEVGRSIGKTVVEFKKGVGGLEDEVREASSPRAAIDPEPVKAPQRVTPATPKPTFDDASLLDLRVASVVTAQLGGKLEIAIPDTRSRFRLQLPTNE